MSAYALAGAALVGIGLYGFLARSHLLRRVLAFNVVGSGLFLVFGGVGQSGVWPAAEGPWGGRGDPVPQALVITGIVVALSATALAAWLVIRLGRETGRPDLPEDGTGEGGG